MGKKIQEKLDGPSHHTMGVHLPFLNDVWHCLHDASKGMRTSCTTDGQWNLLQGSIVLTIQQATALRRRFGPLGASNERWKGRLALTKIYNPSDSR